MIETKALEMNARSAVQKVRALLPPQEVGGVTLRVVEEGVYLERNFWHVLVRPSADPCSLTEVAEAIADIEVTLMLDEGLNIMLHLSEPE